MKFPCFGGYRLERLEETMLLLLVCMSFSLLEKRSVDIFLVESHFSRHLPWIVWPCKGRLRVCSGWPMISQQVIMLLVNRDSWCDSSIGSSSTQVICWSKQVCVYWDEQQNGWRWRSDMFLVIFHHFFAHSFHIFILRHRRLARILGLSSHGLISTLSFLFCCMSYDDSLVFDSKRLLIMMVMMLVTVMTTLSWFCW